jgi:hypothetical protein
MPSGSLRRLLQTLGLQPRQRDVTPSLSEIMREHIDCSEMKQSNVSDADA